MVVNYGLFIMNLKKYLSECALGFTYVIGFLLLIMFSGCSKGTSYYIHDHESILSSDEVEKLHEKLAQHHDKAGNEIILVTTPNFEPAETIEDFAKIYGDRIGVGSSDKKGVVFVVSEKQSALYILTGKGVIHLLTDDKTQEIIHQTILPHFKNGRYYDGIQYGISRIIRVLEEEEPQFF